MSSSKPITARNKRLIRRNNLKINPPQNTNGVVRDDYDADEREIIRKWLDTDVDVAEYWKIVADVGDGNDTCKLVANVAKCGMPKKSKLLPNPVPGKKQRQLRVHQAVFIVKEGYVPVHQKGHHLKWDERKQLSHICGRTLCRKSEHLREETQKENWQRISCHNALQQTNLRRASFCRCGPRCFWNRVRIN